MVYLTWSWGRVSDGHDIIAVVVIISDVELSQPLSDISYVSKACLCDYLNLCSGVGGLNNLVSSKTEFANIIDLVPLVLEVSAVIGRLILLDPLLPIRELILERNLVLVEAPLCDWG